MYLKINGKTKNVNILKIHQVSRAGESIIANVNFTSLIAIPEISNIDPNVRLDMEVEFLGWRAGGPVIDVVSSAEIQMITAIGESIPVGLMYEVSFFVDTPSSFPTTTVYNQIELSKTIIEVAPVKMVRKLDI